MPVRLAAFDGCRFARSQTSLSVNAPRVPTPAAKVDPETLVGGLDLLSACPADSPVACLLGSAPAVAFAPIRCSTLVLRWGDGYDDQPAGIA
jgi:hypothetical protein